MSLINEALKKAQAQQTGGQNQGSTPPDNNPPDRPDKHSKTPNKWLIILVLLLTAGGFGGGTALVIWGLTSGKEEVASEDPVESLEQQDVPESGVERITFKSPDDTPNEPVTDQKPAPKSETPADSSNPASEPAHSPKPAPAKVNQEPQPVAPKPEPEQVPAKKTTANNTPAPESNKIAKEQLPEKTSFSKPKPNPDVEAYLMKLEVRGVMSGGKKILLYDNQTGSSSAYDSGSTINASLGIKISRITEKSIYFTDNGGFTYIKRF